MAKQYAKQYKVENSKGTGHYIVSLTYDGNWECSCIGWTRHVPRKDCKHISLARIGRGFEINVSKTPIIKPRKNAVLIIKCPICQFAFKSKHKEIYTCGSCKSAFRG